MKTIELKLTIDVMPRDAGIKPLYCITDSSGKIRICGTLSPEESDAFVPLAWDSSEARAAYASMNYLFCSIAKDIDPDFFKHE